MLYTHDIRTWQRERTKSIKVNISSPDSSKHTHIPTTEKGWCMQNTTITPNNNNTDVSPAACREMGMCSAISPAPAPAGSSTRVTRIPFFTLVFWYCMVSRWASKAVCSNNNALDHLLQPLLPLLIMEDSYTAQVFFRTKPQYPRTHLSCTYTQSMLTEICPLRFVERPV